MQTFEISDIDGGNKRRVTLPQFRAELDARRPYTRAISDAWRRGDLAGVEAAQSMFRAKFPR